MTEKNKDKLSVSEIKRLFEESKTQSAEHLAELRSFNNLFQGNHFNKTNSRLSRTLNEMPNTEEVKARVTKNHINTISKYIINSILSLAPTGVITPKNPSEIQDQKSAEIHGMIFSDFKGRNKLNTKIRSWVHDYVVSGECFLNLFWDDNVGIKIFPSPFYDQLGNEVQEPPFFEGDVVIERIFPWDVRMDVGAKSFDEASWVGYEKMVDGDVLKKSFGNHPDIDKAIKADSDDTYKVFQASTGTYKEAKGKVLLRQIYYRPCSDYPNGLYMFMTKEIELARGELPVDKSGNVFFPIKYLGFDEIPTCARSTSCIKQIRQEQYIVNQCASNIMQTQMTVGFDKLLVPAGGEISAGTHKAGIRIIRVPGGKQNADYIPGRSGDQFLATMTQNISEMYTKLGVPENWDEKNQDMDIMASLYKNMRQKTRFSLYAEKFSEFLCDVIETSLRLKKSYMRDETFFRVTGKSEYANIAEFRSLDDLGYQIKVEGGTEDLESRFGRYMALTQTMQYLGNNLDKNAIGMIMKNLPFNNNEEIGSKYTQGYENARNIMLALDRGEMPQIIQTGEPLYFSEELEHRMLKPDFRYLTEQIKQAYTQQAQAYRDLYTQNMQQVQMAQSGFIPADGPTVPVDGMYESSPGPNGEMKTKRVQVPQAAIEWVIEKLKSQGQAFGNVESLPMGQQAQVASQYMQGMSPMQQQQAPTQGAQGI